MEASSVCRHCATGTIFVISLKHPNCEEDMLRMRGVSGGLAAYKGSLSTTFDIVGYISNKDEIVARPPAAGTTWLKIGEVDAVAAASVDFTGIASTIADLHLLFELLPGTNAVSLLLQTYGADGVLDVGATDYRMQEF